MNCVCRKNSIARGDSPGAAEVGCGSGGRSCAASCATGSFAGETPRGGSGCIAGTVVRTRRSGRGTRIAATAIARGVAACGDRTGNCRGFASRRRSDRRGTVCRRTARSRCRRFARPRIADCCFAESRRSGVAQVSAGRPAAGLAGGFRSIAAGCVARAGCLPGRFGGRTGVVVGRGDAAVVDSPALAGGDR